MLSPLDPFFMSCFCFWQNASVSVGKTWKVIWQSDFYTVLIAWLPPHGASCRCYWSYLQQLQGATSHFLLLLKEQHNSNSKKRDHCTVHAVLLRFKSITKLQGKPGCTTRKSLLFLMSKKVSNAKQHVNGTRLHCSYTPEVSADTPNPFASFMSCI